MGSVPPSSREASTPVNVLVDQGRARGASRENLPGRGTDDEVSPRGFMRRNSGDFGCRNCQKLASDETPEGTSQSLSRCRSHRLDDTQVQPSVATSEPVKGTEMSTSEMAVEVEGLTKNFGAVQALRGLDLTVPSGQVTGFLGPNGSGKTTAIRVLLGLLRPDGGRASIFGADPWTDAVALHRRMAYVPGDVTLWPNLTGGEAIDILVRLSGPLDPKRKALMLDRFELDPTKKARTYSKGNRQKVALVAALASHAELLVLDEPTSGLDPLMEAAFTESIREAKALGTSVLLSSHIFAEVEKLADRVTIIRDGAAVESGTIAQMRHLTRTEVTVVLDSVPDELARMAGVHDFVVAEGRAAFSVDESAMPAVLAAVATLRPRSFVANPPSLEAMFLRHYGSQPDTTAATAGIGAKE